MEWVHYTKGTLDSIKKLTLLSRERLSDREFGNFLSRMITDEIDHADLWLNSFLHYFHTATPLQKANTVNTLVDWALKKNQAQLEGRGVKLSKNFEKNLPEIIVPDEPLKYILNSVLQYILTSNRSKGSIELSTKSFLSLKEGWEVQTGFEEYGGCVEILMVFMEEGPPPGEPRAAGEWNPSLQVDEAMRLMLRLIEEMVQRNRGSMRMEVDKNRSKTGISLRFPVERRKSFYYEPMSTNPPDKPLKILDS